MSSPEAIPWFAGIVHGVVVQITASAPTRSGALGASSISNATSICVDVTSSYRSDEHTSELQSLMRISSAVFCLKKKNITPTVFQLIPLLLHPPYYLSDYPIINIL